jgi:hypothetical protein
LASQETGNDFEGALEMFGINALLGRAIQLAPPEIRGLLEDFRRSWQMLEVDRIRAKTPGLTMMSAHALYTLCNLLEPPEVLPQDKQELATVLAGEVCSSWTAVLALRHLGAFRD